MAEILVTGKRISDMELIPTISGDEKIPTGVSGDYAITPDQIAGYVNDRVKAKWGAIDGDIDTQVDLKNKFIGVNNTISAHVNNEDNPHKVTAEQVGLGNVDNTSDLDKPISNSVTVALSDKVSFVKLEEALDGLNLGDLSTQNAEELMWDRNLKTIFSGITQEDLNKQHIFVVENYSDFENIPDGVSFVYVSREDLSGFFSLSKSMTIDHHDGGTVITDKKSRTWGRLYSGRKNIKWFDLPNTGDVTVPVQNALNFSGLFYFPKGDYEFTLKPLEIKSNTDIELHPEAKLINNISNTNYLYGILMLNAPHLGEQRPTENIKISGGTITCEPRAKKGLLSQHLGFMMNDGLIIQNVNFDYPSANTHSIEVNSSVRTVISGCSFSNYLANGATLGSREYINIDFSGAVGYPWVTSGHDGGVVKDLIVSNCTFKDGDVAVGTHSAPPSGLYMEGIQVIDCHIENMTSSSIVPRYWKGSYIARNTIKNGGSQVIKGWGLHTSTIENNQLTSTTEGYNRGIIVSTDGVFTGQSCKISGNTLDGFDTAVFITNSVNIEVSGNNFTQTSNNAVNIYTGTKSCSIINNRVLDQVSGTYPFYIRGEGSVISGNTIEYLKMEKPESVLLVRLQEGSGQRTVISNNTSSSDTYLVVTTLINQVYQLDGYMCVDLGVSSAVKIPFSTKTNQGLFSVSTASQLQYGLNGLFYGRSGITDTPVCNVISAVDDYTFGVYTEELTGSTGTDGSMSISCFNGHIYLENRTNLTRRVSCGFLGSV